MSYPTLSRISKLIRDIHRGNDISAEEAKRLGWSLHLSDELIELRPERPAIDYMVFRRNAKVPIVLQVPHAKSETHLFDVVSDLFGEIQARALWITVGAHRKEVDSAHTYASDMSVATAAALAHDPELVFASIHGFQPTTKNQLIGTDAIISSGTWWPSARAYSLYRELKKILRKKDQVLLFPWHVYQLGGTTNAQGQIIRDWGSPESFLHLELSLEYRAELRKSTKDRKEFGRCLVEAVNTYPSKPYLPLADPWNLPIGRKARANMTGDDILRFALGVSQEEYDQTYRGHPKVIASKLNVPVGVVNYYLEL